MCSLGERGAEIPYTARISLFVTPNVRQADELVHRAMRQRYGDAADFETRGAEAGMSLAEVMLCAREAGLVDEVPVMSPAKAHYGKIARLLAQLVYLLTINSRLAAGLSAHSVYVVDIMHPVIDGGQTSYLAVAVSSDAPGPMWYPVLMPLPDLSSALLEGHGSMLDTRDELRAFAVAVADRVNLALPAARALAVGESDD